MIKVGEDKNTTKRKTKKGKKKTKQNKTKQKQNKTKNTAS